MAYQRLGLKDFDTANPFAAKHVEHIEDGIVQNESDITTLNADLTDLKVQQVRTAGTSMDDWKDEGIYYFSGTYCPDDAPSGTNGWLFVYPYTETSVKQIWMRFGTPGSSDKYVYHRTSNASGFGQWWRFAMTDDIDSDSMAKNLGQVSDISDLASAMDDAGTYNYVFFTTGSSLRSTLTNGDNTSTSFTGTACKTSSTQYGYMIHSYSTIYTGRFTSDGSVTYCYKFSGEQIQTNSITPSDTGEPVVMGEDETVED